MNPKKKVTMQEGLEKGPHFGVRKETIDQGWIKVGEIGRSSVKGVLRPQPLPA